MHLHEHHPKSKLDSEDTLDGSGSEIEIKIVLQRKLSIKAVNLIVHMDKENEDKVRSRSNSSIGRKPSSQNNIKVTPFLIPKFALMQRGVSNEAP